ncbi:hypothetical protein AB0K04_11165 [Micromonospora coxensis]
MAIRWASIHIRRRRVIRASMCRYCRRAIFTAVTASGTAASSRQGSSTGWITVTATAVASTPTTPVSRLTVWSTMDAASAIPRSRTRSISSAKPASSKAASSTAVVASKSRSSTA